MRGIAVVASGSVLLTVPNTQTSYSSGAVVYRMKPLEELVGT
jgi:hypothetical protein